jgi:hypothetical protein
MVEAWKKFSFFVWEGFHLRSLKKFSKTKKNVNERVELFFYECFGKNYGVCPSILMIIIVQ